MKNYKALKSASKVSVKKATVTFREAVDAVKYKDGDEIPSHKKVGDDRIEARDAETREVLQIVSKVYDRNTGEAKDDLTKTIDVASVTTDVNTLKDEIAYLQSKQADLEQLEKDLKAL